ncbi:hypothetical protein CMI38_00225 [Candidatus Pacearchaeota archaeon]|jgi:hypothetical protein|nr:hypothetical protein [Candidatus Pacearchaeota archaeon]|tara:strand:+ start:10877 stop:11359 length:483 start_codon:yes stop_codon:yes gene_type:complete
MGLVTIDEAKSLSQLNTTQCKSLYENFLSRSKTVGRSDELTSVTKIDFIRRVYLGDKVLLSSNTENGPSFFVYGGVDIPDPWNFEECSLDFFRQDGKSTRIERWNAGFDNIEFGDESSRVVLYEYTFISPGKYPMAWGKAYGLLKNADQWQGKLTLEATK